MYNLYMNLPQSDFRRYIQHAKFYTSRQLAIASIVLKDELKTNLTFLPADSDDVYIQLFNDGCSTASLLFAFQAKDVYFKLEYTPNNNEHWIAIVNKDEQNTSYTNQSYVSEEVFENEVSKPLKLLVAMYYQEILEFMHTEMKRLKDTMEFVKNIHDKIESNLTNNTDIPVEKAEEITEENDDVEI